jgi:hypothetical protein
MNEIPHTLRSSVSFGWAFCWRNAVLVAALTLIQQQVAPQPGPLVNLLMLVLFILSAFVAAHWLRARGFGSVKVVLVEWAEYQKNHASIPAQPGAQADGPASGGPAA